MAEYFASGRRRIVGVKAHEDFSLSLLFDNGEKKVFNMKDLIQPDTVNENTPQVILRERATHRLQGFQNQIPHFLGANQLAAGHH